MLPRPSALARRLGLVGAAVLATALVLSPRPAAALPGETAASHLQRANKLVGLDQLDAACGELEAAYASSKDPLLWLRLGRLRLRLHQPAAARAAMQRFIDESPAPHPALKAEAQRALYTLREVPLAPPPAAPPPASQEGSMALYHDLRLLPLQIRPARNRRLLKLGGGLLLGSYLPALAVSIGMSPFIGQPDAPSAGANYTLLIPVVGPLVSAIVAPATNDRGNGRQLLSSWSLPWALTSGVLQLAGFAMLVAGAIPRPVLVPVLAARLQVVPYADGSGGGVWAAARF
jgi:hypothetical protein